MKQLNWTETKKRAQTMTVDQLVWAIGDCSDAAKALDGVRVGFECKSAGYYSDEGSVYMTELLYRNALAEKRAAKRAAKRVSA